MNKKGSILLTFVVFGVVKLIVDETCFIGAESGNTDIVWREGRSSNHVPRREGLV